MANSAPTRHTLFSTYLQMRILLLKVFSTRNVFSYLLSSGVVYTCSTIPNENRVLCCEHLSIRTSAAATGYGGATSLQWTNAERREFTDCGELGCGFDSVAAYHRLSFVCQHSAHNNQLILNEWDQFGVMCRLQPNPRARPDVHVSWDIFASSISKVGFGGGSSYANAQRPRYNPESVTSNGNREYMESL